MKSKNKVVQEYDKQVAKEDKVNQAQFASKHGVAKSTILARKMRQSTAVNEHCIFSLCFKLSDNVIYIINLRN